ncbi:MAG: hypothetical protein ACRD3Q_09545, partial [Terriglobales bacterium]
METNPLSRLKVLINSSTPIVVMETAEEPRAVSLVRQACSDLNMATFEWTIADGLARSGSTASVTSQTYAKAATAIPQGNSEDSRLARAVLSSLAADGNAQKSSIYNTTDPVQALANMEAMTLEAVFILKDFHRHMDNPVVVRRLRDVGQKFSLNRRTLVLTAPAIEMPRELTSLVEYLDLPLPDQARLCEIIRETYTR